MGRIDHPKRRNSNNNYYNNYNNNNDDDVDVDKRTTQIQIVLFYGFTIILMMMRQTDRRCVLIDNKTYFHISLFLHNTVNNK